MFTAWLDPRATSHISNCEVSPQCTAVWQCWITLAQSLLPSLYFCWQVYCVQIYTARYTGEKTHQVLYFPKGYQIQGVFFTRPPPKMSKFRKVNLGYVRCIYLYLSIYTFNFLGQAQCKKIPCIYCWTFLIFMLMLDLWPQAGYGSYTLRSVPSSPGR